MNEKIYYSAEDIAKMLAIMPAEYSRNPKNISRDKWKREMSMKEIILRDAKMCAYASDEKTWICIQERCVDGSAGTRISVLS